MRLIDADYFKENGYVHDLGYYGECVFYETIEDAPTVDAVPVIRCKDCIWYVIAELTKDGRRDKRYKPSYCLLMQQYLSENNYCSCGEKDETREEKE